MIFFLFHIEIEGKCWWIIGGGGGGQRVFWPPSQIIGGVWPPCPPLFLRLCSKDDSIGQSKRYKIGRQKKEMKDNINEWAEMNFASTTSAVERQDKEKKGLL